jgi:hypothetical protein
MMTDREMRVRLAQAMGWMDLRAGAVRTLSGVFPEQNILVRTEVPDPLESDRDAALLRAWCAGRGWRITCCHDEGAAWWRVSDLRCQGPRAESMADAKEEPDYCRRERLALCRAVLAVVEIGCASRGPLHGLAGPQV